MAEERRQTSGAVPNGVRDDALRRLGRAYDELDRRLAEVLARALGAECRVCGTCCTFPPKGDVLYGTALEREYLASARPPPGEHPAGSCPYLRSDRCTSRERRTVGCRAHFCAFVLPSQAARDECRALGEAALADVREIAKDLGLDWDYAPVVEGLAARGIR